MAVAVKVPRGVCPLLVSAILFKAGGFKQEIETPIALRSLNEDVDPPRTFENFYNGGSNFDVFTTVGGLERKPECWQPEKYADALPFIPLTDSDSDSD